MKVEHLGEPYTACSSKDFRLLKTFLPQRFYFYYEFLVSDKKYSRQLCEFRKITKGFIDKCGCYPGYLVDLISQDMINSVRTRISHN